ncbi:MAG: ATP-binding protein [Planctomycetaceae bacterium]|jgi:serine/threonine-protein kinase RsbW|nr:ATP-binding protein [Planctomycetaceae bacterium]
MNPDDSQWTWTKEGSIKNDLNEAHSVINEVLERVRSAQWNGKDVFAVELTLEEAFVNAVMHGNKSDKSKRVHYVCRLSPRHICYSIEDEGEGFAADIVADPTRAENIDIPSGRGVHLIRGFAARSRWNEKGNIVTVEIDKSDN